jgi:chorismate mutase/prephenate dehydratase
MSGEPEMLNLDEIRKEIDQTDEKLLDILAERMRLVSEVSKWKEKEGLAVFDADRERKLFESIATKATKRGLEAGLVERLLRAIIAHSRRRQNHTRQISRTKHTIQHKTFSFQGSNGAYSWLAGQRCLGQEWKGHGFSKFSQALDALLQGEVERAVLPIQNSLAGSIHEVYKLLGSSDTHVIGEEYMRVDHCLIGLSASSHDQLRRIYSHPVALRQCREYMLSNPGIEFVADIDTAMAVQRIKEDNDPTQAAIASSSAASLHNMKIIEGGISDHPENTTRFWIVARNPETVADDIAAITSLVLVTSHSEGALVDALQVISSHGINMLKLESHSREGIPWEHSFYIDLEGNVASRRLESALAELDAHAKEIRLLGCYPRAH